MTPPPASGETRAYRVEGELGKPYQLTVIGPTSNHVFTPEYGDDWMDQAQSECNNLNSAYDAGAASRQGEIDALKAGQEELGYKWIKACDELAAAKALIQPYARVVEALKWVVANCPVCDGTRVMERGDVGPVGLIERPCEWCRDSHAALASLPASQKENTHEKV